MQAKLAATGLGHDRRVVSPRPREQVRRLAGILPSTERTVAAGGNGKAPLGGDREVALPGRERVDRHPA